MSFTQKILIPLSDQVDTSLIEHEDVFEGEGDRIALKIFIAFEDDFNDNIIDPAKWDVIDTGSGSVVAQNQRLEITGSGAWNQTGVITDDAFAIAAGTEAFFTQFNAATNRSIMGFFGTTSLALTDANQSSLNISGTNTFTVVTNGSSVVTGFTSADEGIYDCWVTYDNPGWTWYIRSPNDVNYDPIIWTKIHQTLTDSTGPLYFHSQINGASMHWLDDVTILSGYSTASPSPVTVWTAVAEGAEIDMSTAKCWMFKDGVIQAAGNTDVKFKYAANNGALGSALTLTALRAEGNPTITDAANSFKAVGVYASDGTYESMSSAWLEVDAIFPEGGGGGLGVINRGIINV